MPTSEITMFTNALNILNQNPYELFLAIWLAVWELVRKAIALYKAWQKRDVVWFVLIFIFNTCGILPIIYLLLNREKTDKTL